MVARVTLDHLVKVRILSGQLAVTCLLKAPCVVFGEELFLFFDTAETGKAELFVIPHFGVPLEVPSRVGRERFCQCRHQRHPSRSRSWCARR